MYAEGAADAADLNEHFEEIGPGCEEFTELVQHNQQGRQRLQRRTRRSCPLVTIAVGEVAARTKKFL